MEAQTITRKATARLSIGERYRNIIVEIVRNSLQTMTVFTE